MRTRVVLVVVVMAGVIVFAAGAWKEFCDDLRNATVGWHR